MQSSTEKLTGTDNGSISATSELADFKHRLESAQSYICSLETRNQELFSALCDAYEVR